MKVSNSPDVLVVKPTRIRQNGSVISANFIVTNCNSEEQAISEAKEHSGLSKFESWNFLIYGTLSRGKVKKSSSYDKQVNNIMRKKMFSN